jgi:uncharacterized RDD family membrane protein YckC
MPIKSKRKTVEESVNLFGDYAGFVSRFIAFILDSIFCALLVICIFGISSLTNELFQITHMMELLAIRIPLMQVVVNVLTSSWFHVTVAVFAIFLYQTLFIFIAGQTPAKRLLGLQVISYRSERIPYWRAALRYLAYFISGIPFGLGFLWILIDNRRMGWHDKIAGTYVLYAWEARPDEVFLKRAVQVLTSRSAAMEELRTQRRRLAAFVRKDDPNEPANEAIALLEAPSEAEIVQVPGDQPVNAGVNAAPEKKS